MAVKPVVTYPHPCLQKEAEPVGEITDEIAQLIEDMLDTMYEDEDTVALAAPQLGVSLQIIVLDLSETRDQPLCLLNPEIISQEGRVESEEGCASFPGVYITVPRNEIIQVEAYDFEGSPIELEAEGLLSYCLQHEIDHLQGKLFIDHLTDAEKERVLKEFQKIS